MADAFLRTAIRRIRPHWPCPGDLIPVIILRKSVCVRAWYGVVGANVHPAWEDGMERWIATHNIERFEAMLAESLPPDRRSLLEQLLLEERRKLAELGGLPVDEKPVEDDSPPGELSRPTIAQAMNSRT